MTPGKAVIRAQPEGVAVGLKVGYQLRVTNQKIKQKEKEKERTTGQIYCTATFVQVFAILEVASFGLKFGVTL